MSEDCSNLSKTDLEAILRLTAVEVRALLVEAIGTLVADLAQGTSIQPNISLMRLRMCKLTMSAGMICGAAVDGGTTLHLGLGKMIVASDVRRDFTNVQYTDGSPHVVGLSTFRMIRHFAHASS